MDIELLMTEEGLEEAIVAMIRDKFFLYKENQSIWGNLDEYLIDEKTLVIKIKEIVAEIKLQKQ